MTAGKQRPPTKTSEDTYVMTKASHFARLFVTLALIITFLFYTLGKISEYRKHFTSTVTYWKESENIVSIFPAVTLCLESETNEWQDKNLTALFFHKMPTLDTFVRKVMKIRVYEG